MIKIKIKRFGLIEVTEERLARADGRLSFFLTRLKSLARADGRSSLRRATGDERRVTSDEILALPSFNRTELERTTLKWPILFSLK